MKHVKRWELSGTFGFNDVIAGSRRWGMRCNYYDGSMRTEMSFDPEKLRIHGHSREDIYYTVKKRFEEEGLICIYENNEVLIFGDTGSEHDYARMWNLIMSLVLSDWFYNTVSSLIFTDEEGQEEDVLSQAWKVRGIES